MQNLFNPEYQWLWTLGLGLGLFFPVRQMIWALSVRRAVAKEKDVAVDEAESLRLKKRATFTSVLLCFIFSVLYVNSLF